MGKNNFQKTGKGEIAVNDAGDVIKNKLSRMSSIYKLDIAGYVIKNKLSRIITIFKLDIGGIVWKVFLISEV